MLLCLIFLSSLQDLRLRLPDLAGTAVILLIGAITPMEEIYRALNQPSWPFHDSRSLMEAAQGTLPPHYVARLNQPQLQQAMRVPSTVSSP